MKLYFKKVSSYLAYYVKFGYTFLIKLVNNLIHSFKTFTKREKVVSITSLLVVLILLLSIFGLIRKEQHSVPTTMDNKTHTLALVADSKSEAKSKVLSGLVTIDNKTYYYVNGTPQWGVYKVGDNSYFFDKDSKTLMNKMGYYQAQDGKFYMVSDKGLVLSGKVDWQGSTYYFDKDNFQRVDNSYEHIGDHDYYFNQDGQMIKDGFTNFNNTYQYYGTDGHQYKDEFLVKWGNTYYFDKNGNQYHGKYSNWGHDYYFDNNGVLLRNTSFALSGIIYHADANGILSEGKYRLPFDVSYDPRTNYQLDGQQFGFTGYDRGYNDYFHDGWDFGSDQYGYNAIHSISSGTVYSVSYSSDGRGWHVNVKTDDGLYVTYQEAFSSQNQIKVYVGQHLNKGDIIGYLDMSHLHMGISSSEIESAQWAWNLDNGVWQNPINVIYAK